MRTGKELLLSAGQEIVLHYPAFFYFAAGLDGELFFSWKNEKINYKHYLEELEILRSITGFPSESPLQLVLRLRKDAIVATYDISEIGEEEIFQLRIENFLKLIWRFTVKLEDPVLMDSTVNDLLLPIHQNSWAECSSNCMVGPLTLPAGFKMPLFSGQKLYSKGPPPVYPTEIFFRDQEPKNVLSPLFQFIFSQTKAIISRLNEEENNAFEKKVLRLKQNSFRGLNELATAVGNDDNQLHPQPGKGSTWIESVNQMAKLVGFRQIKEKANFENINDLLDHYSSSHQFKYRRISLTGEWWKVDHGPLLLIGEDGESRIVVFKNLGYKVLLKPVSYSNINKKFKGEAFMFYCTFPDEKITPYQLMKFSFKGKSASLFVLLLSVMGASVLAGLIPLLTATVFNSILPTADTGLLYVALIGFVLLVLSFSIFQLVRNFLLNKLEGMVDLRIQSAVWARLLELPLNFFKNFSSSELSERVMGVNRIRILFTQSLSSAAAGILIAIVNLSVMFYLIPKLALVFSIMVVIYFTALSVLTKKEIGKVRESGNRKNELYAIIQQMLNGILRIKLSGAESRVFANWAGRFGIMEKQRAKVIRLNTINRLINKHAPFIFIIFIFIFGLHYAKDSGVGNFIAFQSAFGSFFGAALAITSSMPDFSNLMYLSKRIQPILQSDKEVSLNARYPGLLTGDIEFLDVYFKYLKDGANVLNGFSLRIRPGEFIAIVGASGSGKSTLMRVLLGFEKIDSGKVFIDEKELIQLDIREVRKQIGVVMQSTQIIAGSILENIVGNGKFTGKEAWEAAKKAGLAEELEALPMGMNTMLSESGETLSGGQKQKILIAKSLIHNPAILIFDEATSALDNVSQKIVMESIEKMPMTRIVIAHRFSTIRNADRIVVLSEGKIVQEGTYEKLLTQPGLFCELAERQVI